MRRRANLLVFLGIVVLLTFATSGGASDLCGGAAAASGGDDFLSLMEAAPPQARPEALPDSLDLRQPLLKASFCSRETCSAARQECLEWCPYPCTLTFRCEYPICGECVSCTC